jgi:hypothetical protein
MYDMLPFPNINATNIDELTFQANNYLIQFKETLEFILANIGPDNLSNDLMEQLNSLGADVEKTIEETDDQIKQVAGNAITVADVINAQSFKEALKGATPKDYIKSVERVSNGLKVYAVEDGSTGLKQYTIVDGKTPKVEFSINFETGNLDYTTS